MGIFGKSEESAAETLKEQNAKIKSFIEALEGGPSFNPFRRREDPVDDLLSFCHSAIDALGQYQLKVSRYGGRIEELGSVLDEKNERIFRLAKDREQLAKERDHLLRKLDDAEQDHVKGLSMLTLEHEDKVNNMNSQFNKVVAGMKEDRNKLIGQLFVSHADTKEWPDEKLKLKYRDLQRTIQSLSKTKEFRLQPGQKLPSQWDTSDFMGRVTVKGVSHFLLRSIIWRIILEQYFSAPYGFGALGPGKGKEELDRCYKSWLQLIQGDSSSSNNDYSIFQQPFANFWRQATFQSVATICEDSKSSHHLAQIAQDHSQETILKIRKLLNDTAQSAGTSVPAAILAENGDIEQLVNLAAEIALQFGIHQSHLKLISPELGETVIIGEEYHHCQDADLEKGKAKVVELVTLPGFVKAGDYKSKGQEYFFVPCEIYYTT